MDKLQFLVLICLIVAGKLFHTSAPFCDCRREWYVCVEQQVFCRKISEDDVANVLVKLYSSQGLGR